MNDTIINSRQKKILDILQKRGELSRLQISDFLKEEKPISKITLIRDLNSLKELKLVESKGEARFIKYFIPNLNPLLQYIEMDEYFEIEAEDRKIKDRFNTKIFNNLINLYTKDEINIWQNASEEFVKRSNLLDPSIYKRELERFIIEFSWKSSQIEGNTYDLLETETLLIQNIEAQGHPKEEAIMLINHKNALDLILKERNRFKKLKYADVIQLHNILTKGLITSGIRNQPVRISGTNYVPMINSHDLENALRKLVDMVNTINFPGEKALILRFWHIYNHLKTGINEQPEL